jgi:hypothetical protein
MLRKISLVRSRRLNPVHLLVVGSVLLAGPAVAQPELVVRLDGAVLANHADLEVADTAVGETNQLVVVLRNEGDQDLVFSETPPVALAGGFADQFELVQPALEAGNKLSPNGSTAFAIRFSPEIDFDNLYTHVYIWTNASASPFHLVVSGTSLAPMLRVFVDSYGYEDDAMAHDGMLAVGDEVFSGDTVLLPHAEVGSSSSVTLELLNDGDAPLNLLDTPVAQLLDSGVSGMVIITQPSSVIAPGESSYLMVQFTPAAADAFADSLSMKTNDPGLTDGLFELLFGGVGLAVVEDDQIENGAEENQEEDLNEDELDEDDPGDVELDEVIIDGDVPLIPGAPCGLGVGMFSMLSLVSMGAMKQRPLRRRR